MLSSCEVNKAATSGDEEKTYVKRGENEPGVFYSLADHLKRVPGLQQVDGVFRIRGNISFNADTEPLYVINGVPVGQSYEQANAIIDVNDIKSVRVLKDVGSTNKYGMRGSSGVVEITVRTDG